MREPQTIQQRLRLSNILSLVVPLAVCIVVVLLCAGIFLVQLRGGLDLGISDAEDMATVGRVTSETAGHILDAGGDPTAALGKLAQSLSGSGVVLEVTADDGTLVYSSGSADLADELMTSAATLDDTNGVLVSEAGTSLYLHREGAYHIALFAHYAEVRGHALKRALVISLVLVIAAAAASIALLGRVSKHLVLDRVTARLDSLSEGVSRIAQGDLTYRLPEDTEDEFSPICRDFNTMADALAQADERSAAAQRSRQELIAGISHDLRSPLTSIQGYVEGLLDGVATTPERQRRYLETIDRKAQELSHLVSELFLFSKLDLDDYPATIEEGDLSAAAASALADIREGGTADGITLSEDLMSPIPCRFDRELLFRCISNIVGNAVKYAPGCTLAVRTAAEPDAAILELADNGPGVPDETLPHLFDVFFRTDPARQHPGTGSGLGLAVVARAMQRMGGHAEALKTPGGGLTIRLAFPKA
jgi:signal transduction histidine kinase